ncbi:MAG: hypothetical protein AAGE01_22815 [Pseudomonadota bacterium]
MKIALLGSALPASGFGRVLRASARALASQGHEVHWIGIGNKRDACTVQGYRLHPCNRHGGDVFGSGALAELHAAVDLDAAIVLNDAWMLNAYQERALHHEDVPPLFAWIPVDGAIPESLPLSLAGFRGVAPYTTFGRAQLASRGDGVAGWTIIGHGFEGARFAPLPDAERRADRGALFPAWPPDAVVVLNANRPMPRKHLDVTIAGFAAALSAAPALRLVLHWAHVQPEELALGTDLLRHHGIEDAVHLSTQQLTDSELNRLYNACEIGLNTSSGEGWGLVSFEHAMTGAAQVVPANSVLPELWGDGASYLACDPIRPDYSCLELAVPRIDAVAEALTALADPVQRQLAADASRASARERCHSWTTIADRWTGFIEHTLH